MKKNKKTEISFLYDEKGNKVGVRLDRKKYKKLVDLVHDYEDYQAAVKYQKKTK